jgi:GNAT superfamily N-acetyltransferase
VITLPHYRKKGFASLLLSAAKDTAVTHNCYKIMLMTGSKQESTLSFYQQAGYNSNDKTAFIQWL